MRFFTSSDAFAISCWDRCRGISFRRPSCSARMESPSARVIMCRKPKSEKRAPLLLATEFTNFLIATRHQHVCDRLLDEFSFRDREQMRLALGAGVGNQSVRLEPLGLLEYGAGDIDRIVKGKFMDDIDRGVIETGHPPCKLGTGRDFNRIRQQSNYLAKGPYLVVAIPAGDQ